VTGWLLDTNVLSELRRPRPAEKVVAFVASQPLESLNVSSVTLAEIRFGIELVADAGQRAELNDWLTHKIRPLFARRVLPVSEDTMSNGASWSKRVARTVTPIRNPISSSRQRRSNTG
jgi:toxin FitB